MGKDLAGDVQEMCGRCAGDVREMCGRCAGDGQRWAKIGKNVREIEGFTYLPTYLPSYLATYLATYLPTSHLAS